MSKGSVNVSYLQSKAEASSNKSNIVILEKSFNVIIFLLSLLLNYCSLIKLLFVNQEQQIKKKGPQCVLV